MTRIVVGVDGSRHSRRALRRGVEEARLRNGSVEAVYVYDPPRRPVSEDLIGLPLGTGTPLGGSISAGRPEHDPPSRQRKAQQIAQARLEQFVSEAMEDLDGPVPDLVVLADENVASALTGHASNADLLVIGTRGLGGFAGMLLGSVAHQCIQRSRCPTLILPPEED